MKTLRLTKSAERAAIREALRILGEGGVVAFPTETYYGLGVKFDNPDALRRLYGLKQRAPGKAVSLIVGDMETLMLAAREVTPAGLELITKHWPGALTLLLPARADILPELRLGGKVAVRMPGGDFALRLAKAAGFPITATSANPAGAPPPETAEAVADYFGDSIDLLIDGGRAPGGSASTIADASGEKIAIIRQGGVRIL